MKQLKNPFGQDTPEWQLFENAKSSEMTANSHHDDAQKSQQNSQKAREKAALYWEALAKLGYSHDQ